ncbi:TetR/AcrR family transcriptional regulator [Secundilactobacillus hailunensis]|uniref:TetR/AcrR family transcriptional regulator n=1 Tax=Secundilactobacillus hailunensis TaxID=2559923 RepID=A0ABW1TAC9_9LACO|nr:TetR/AcrR family transcriptional regulator [Secundilactobacillus hailunensis]
MASKRQAYYDATKEALINSARTLFKTKGYAATTVNDITKNANKTRTTFYHYFPDGKVNLIQTLMKLDVTPEFKALGDKFDTLKQVPIVEALQTINQAFVEMFVPNLYLWQADIYFQDELYPALKDITNDEYSGMTAKLAEFFAYRQQQHDLIDFDPETGAKLFLAPALQSIVLTFSGADSDINDTKQVDLLIDQWVIQH